MRNVTGLKDGGSAERSHHPSLRVRRPRAHHGKRRERLRELLRGLETMIAIALQTAKDDLLEVGRHLRRDRADARRIGLEDRGEELAEVVPHERNTSREELVEDDPD